MHRIKTIYIAIITFILLIASCDTYPENESQLLQTENNLKLLQVQELKEGSIISFSRKRMKKQFSEGPYAHTAIKKPVAGDKGAITYVSEKPDIATVDPITGVVTFKTAGKVTITATKEATERYKASTARYFLTIAMFRPEDKAALKTEITRDINAKGNNADLSYIDTSLITDMSELFKGMEDFNGDISQWDVSKVISMDSMFFGATAFSGDLEIWGSKLKAGVGNAAMFRDSGVSKNLPTWCDDCSSP